LVVLVYAEISFVLFKTSQRSKLEITKENPRR